MYTVYILSCSDGAYHWGVTKDLNKRIAYHQSGENPEAYTYKRLPVELVFKQVFTTIIGARSFEDQLNNLITDEIRDVINGKKVLKTKESPAPASVNKREDSSLILPVTYLGNLAYFANLSNYSELILDRNELFQKQTYRSRCTILSANGVQNLVVPVIRPEGKQTKMDEVLISYAENWQKDHTKAIESAYRRSPYYEFYAPGLFSIIEKKHKLLIDLNLELIQFLITVFGWDLSVRFSKEKEQTNIPGKILVTPKSRSDFTGTPYHQVMNENGTFEPNLSLIDLLFNQGKSGLTALTS